MTRRDVEDPGFRSSDAADSGRGQGDEDARNGLRARRLPDPRLRRRVLARLDALLAARKC